MMQQDFRTELRRRSQELFDDLASLRLPMSWPNVWHQVEQLALDMAMSYNKPMKDAKIAAEKQLTSLRGRINSPTLQDSGLIAVRAKEILNLKSSIVYRNAMTFRLPCRFPIGMSAMQTFQIALLGITGFRSSRLEAVFDPAYEPITRDAIQVAEVVHSYAESLWATPGPASVSQRLMSPSTTLRLSPGEADKLTRPVTLAELKNRLKSSRWRSTAGLDGLSFAFYAALPDTALDAIVQLLNERLRGRRPPWSNTEAGLVISFIHKRLYNRPAQLSTVGCG